MDDERWTPGMPVLDRQVGKVSPSRVAETRPTPLQDAFIPISVVVLFCGIVAITALEAGLPLRDPIVRVPVMLGATLLAVVSLDAMLRVWRSAQAWMPVDRGRGAFRIVWVAALALGLLVTAAAAWAALTA